MVDGLPENATLVPLERFQICGVYFLIESNEIIYVGRSANIFSRINEHLYFARKGLSPKNFDSFAYIKVDQNELDSVESEFIRSLNPKMNKASGPKKLQTRVNAAREAARGE